jgi:hypothetical protein
MPNDISAGRMTVDEVTEEPVFALFAAPTESEREKYRILYENSTSRDTLLTFISKLPYRISYNVSIQFILRRKRHKFSSDMRNPLYP